MDAAATKASFLAIQNAFHTLAVLELTQYLYDFKGDVKNDSTFDFIVVGAGSAGSVVARRLAEDRKTQVLLIEAGGDPPFETSIPKLAALLEQTSSDWNYTTEPISCSNNCRRNSRISLGLGKMLGGSSGMDYLLYNEGNRFDYDYWAVAANDSRWKAEGILPYLLKSQMLRNTSIKNSPDRSLFGYKGPIILTKENRTRVYEYLNVFKDLGYPVVTDVNIVRPLGYTSLIYTIGDGIRQNIGLKYLSPIKEYPNLTVLKNTNVLQIIFDKFNNAIGVKARTKNGKILFLKARNEVIISAGAVNTPKLLMLSEIGPKKHLRSFGIKVRSDLPVGKGLQDHTCNIIIHNMRNTPPKTKPRNPHEYAVITFNGFVALNKSQPYPDYQVNNFIIYVSEFMPYCTQTSRLSDEICNNLFYQAGGFSQHDKNELLYTELVNLHPKSEGEILLRSSNYDDPPIVKPEYFKEKVDLDNDAKYIKHFMHIYDSQSFQNMGAKWVDPQLRQCRRFLKNSIEYWQCYAKCLKTTYHDYCGTCALGSVVDNKLRVKGVKRLRVVDASVIPKVPRFQIFAATTTVAEKAADIIKNDYGLA